MDGLEKMRAHLSTLYGKSAGQVAFGRMRELINDYRNRIPVPTLEKLTQRDAILITYGDQVTQAGEAALITLADFSTSHISGAVSGIHILPFYPYTSDDGFSVVDYKAVNPEFGGWEDVVRLGDHFSLMFDAVVNHISVQSAWFKGYCAGDVRYADYFIAVPDGADLSRVIRPRTLPLLTIFSVNGEVRRIWTTFSADQVDLNYSNPAVLLEVLDTLLFYVEKGAQVIRLDAIAFLWKTYGTTCLHLPQTHAVIQLMRALLDQVAPHVQLITETNVPHADNLSYFGDGTNEAQLVYNFGMPPLVLHTLHTGDATILSHWAASLALPSKHTTFFNFLASHDGIGLNPARGILSQDQIDALVERTQAHGGFVSYKNEPDGSASPYELNINYFDALNDPCEDEEFSLKVDRFMASQAIMLTMQGVPGIYFHSLFGSRGWPEGVAQTDHNRTVNRQKLLRADLEAELAEPDSLRSRVFYRYTHLLRVRAAQPAFDPYGEMIVLEAGASIFAVLRSGSSGDSMLCLQNVSNQAQVIDSRIISHLNGDRAQLMDLITGLHAGPGELVLAPYQTLWLVRSGI